MISDLVLGIFGAEAYFCQHGFTMTADIQPTCIRDVWIKGAEHKRPTLSSIKLRELYSTLNKVFNSYLSTDGKILSDTVKKRGIASGALAKTYPAMKLQK